MIKSLNPKSESYNQGQKVISALLTMLEKQDEENEGEGASKRRKMTYEDFVHDPFGTKKGVVLEDFYADQRKAVRGHQEQDEKIDQESPFGQLGIKVNLAAPPSQPSNILNRQLNQIHILNKQHFDLRPTTFSEEPTADRYI